MRLAAKMMLVFLTVVVLMTAVGSYFSVRRGFERFEQRQQEMARETADALNDRLAKAWREGGAEGLLSAMQSMALQDPRHQTRWVWFEQTEVGGNSSRMTIVEQRAGVGSGQLSRTFTDEHGKRHLQTYYPIELGDGPRGGLEITGSLESLDAAARETIAMALVSLGAMAVVSLGLVYFAGLRWVAKPLDRLIAKTQRIGSGDFSEPLPVQGSDELSQLAQALNDMSAKLAQQQQRIHDESAERLATLEQLRHADRLKTVGRLAAGIAHELGTPLNVVSGRAGLIASGKLPDEEITASAKTIKSEADRVTAIIRQLLDFARPSNSQRSRLDISELLRQTITLIEPLAEKRNVVLEMEPAAEQMVSADRSQMQQVFTNLLVNAAQSMSDGGTVTATVRTCRAHPSGSETATERECVAVAICDQGTGIRAVDIENIFEPFFTTKDVGEGTGLGLSIAYGIVQEHGGWIAVESEMGRGSCFTVYLPQE
ncbi:MAG: HAMP domain-containing protein [Planctomycetales bacterium]|nr:HAMP domain-containing protein [Planctomycetales bacterium]